MLSTPDITYEGFGFMLAFGDLVWVPFIFSIQSRFLAEHPHKISLWLAVLVFVLNSKFIDVCVKLWCSSFIL
jgi:hypothetical protein